MVEQRQLKRWHLFFYLRVFDQATKKLLGHVLDISTEGMRMISDEPIPVDEQFDVWLDVPQEDGSRKRIHLNAYSLWSEKDVNPDFYGTGFRLVDPGPETVHNIRLLIDDLRFDE